jgi:hypothetical protein
MSWPASRATPTPNELLMTLCSVMRFLPDDMVVH